MDNAESNEIELESIDEKSCNKNIKNFSADKLSEINESSIKEENITKDESQNNENNKIATDTTSNKSADESSSSNNSEIFQVEKIIDCKVVRKKKYFKVGWQGYGPEEYTWEPEENLRENPNLIEMLNEVSKKFDEKQKCAGVVRRVKKEPKYIEESLSEDEDWFGIKPDQGSREARNLYVADRIPTMTEKILAEIEPGVRVLRNHLKFSVPSLNTSTNTGTNVSSSQKTPKKTRKRRHNAQKSKLNNEELSDDSLKHVSEKTNSKKRRRLKNKNVENNQTAQSLNTLNDVFTLDDSPKTIQENDIELSIVETNDSINKQTKADEKKIKELSKSTKSINLVEQKTDKNFQTHKKEITQVDDQTLSKDYDNKNKKTFQKKLMKQKDLLMEAQNDVKNTKSTVDTTIDKQKKIKNLQQNNKNKITEQPQSSYLSQTSSSSKQRDLTKNTQMLNNNAILIDNIKSNVPKKSSTISNNSLRLKSNDIIKQKKAILNRTIIDSLIPYTSLPSGSGGLNNRSVLGKDTEKRLTAKQLRFESLDLPMRVAPSNKSVNDLIVDIRKKQAEQTQFLNQQMFEEMVMEGRVQQVTMALSYDKERHLDLNSMDNNGRTLLHKLCELKCNPAHTYCELIDVLVKNGARLDMRETVNGQTPLHVAILTRRFCHVKKLLSLNCPVNSTNFLDQPPILACFSCSDVEFVSALLLAGATFQIVFRNEPSQNRHLLKRVRNHQDKLKTVLEKARNMVFTNAYIKTISPIFVNSLHESRFLIHTFHYESMVIQQRCALCVLTFLCDFSSDKMDAFMWNNFTPITKININDRKCPQLIQSNKYVYLAPLRAGHNTLKIELDSAFVVALSSVKKYPFLSYNNGNTDNFDLNYYNLKLLTQVCFIDFNARGATGLVGSNALGLPTSRLTVPIQPPYISGASTRTINQQIDGKRQQNNNQKIF